MRRSAAGLLAASFSILIGSTNAWAAESSDTTYVPPKPAFPGQTKAPSVKKPSVYKTQTVAYGLDRPWSFVLMPNGKFLVTELHGTIRTVNMEGVMSAPIEGVPDVKSVGAEGLHGLAIDPDFAHNRFIYFAYFAPPSGEAPGIWPNSYLYEKVFGVSLEERRTFQVGMERVARARLSEDEKRLEDVKILVEGPDRRVIFAPDGTLFISGPDRFRFYDSDMDGTDHPPADVTTRRNFAGRISRINSDGTIPLDNPFLSDPNVAPDVYSYGHRDPEGLAINPATGELWEIEHGPQGGDEINIIRKGRDYGWPVISYGRQYDNKRVNGGLTAKDGLEQPVYYWDPSIAPSGMMFYTGDLFPDWKGNLFVGALKAQHLARLVLDGNKVVAEETLLPDVKQRIRDMMQGPQGEIYILTGSGNILKLMP
jgi:aldose sugar dehydrogenase